MSETTANKKSNAYFRFLSKLESALEEEHCERCEQSEQNTCDINAAYRNGFTLVAAYLLSSATECPLTDQALQRIRVLYPKLAGSNLYDCNEWNKWKEFFDRNTTQCTACDAFVWNDESEQVTCGNCLAVLPRKNEEEE